MSLSRAIHGWPAATASAPNKAALELELDVEKAAPLVLASHQPTFAEHSERTSGRIGCRSTADE